MGGIERKASRRVIQTEALAYLKAHPADEGTSVVTSLPDVSEMSELSFDQWRSWFVEASALILRWVPPRGVAIFYQSDIRYRGKWVDKSYLIQRAAEEAGADLLWHRIVCRKPAGTFSLGRPSYSHLVCFATGPRSAETKPFPDVLPDAGLMPWSRAMGANACQLCCDYLLKQTETKLVVDPFCGKGTVLAVANAMGLDALGMDISAKRCRAARNMVF
ncbi:MAG TPA: DNA methyltransferase [Polyangiaceae bacterium]|jgi:hypothetical protein|nr:DNA methyltransferase [Polyangiaceae bacterium]